jgi:hypothetical protein
MPNGINHHLLKPTLLYPPRRSERGATPPGRPGNAVEVRRTQRLPRSYHAPGDCTIHHSERQRYLILLGYWHPHNFEILLGQSSWRRGMPNLAEKELMKLSMNSYGKS